MLGSEIYAVIDKREAKLKKWGRKEPKESEKMGRKRIVVLSSCSQFEKIETWKRKEIFFKKCSLFCSLFSQSKNTDLYTLTIYLTFFSS